MSSEFHKRAISRIEPEERARMVKSIEILSQIHAILDRQQIGQKQLAVLLGITQPAVSKMLSPGGNLGIHTIVRLEVLLGETILTTPQKNAADTGKKDWGAGVQECRAEWDCRKVTYTTAETILAPLVLSIN